MSNRFRALTALCAAAILLACATVPAATAPGGNQVNIKSDTSWWGLTVEFTDPAALVWTDSALTGNASLTVPLASTHWTAAYLYEPGVGAYTYGMYFMVESFGSGGATLDMVSVPAGSFTMGARDDWADGTFGDSDEYPRHTVTLSSYYIGKYEVTNAEMCEVLNWALSQDYLTNASDDAYTTGNVYAAGQMVLEITSGQCQISYDGSAFVSETRDSQPMGDHPVVEVTWYGAVCFCNWLSEKEVRTPAYNLSTWQLSHQSGNGYRLPTEAEWERAAAWDGPTHWIFAYQSDTSNANAMNYAWNNPLGLSGYPYTTPVGYYDGTNGTSESLSAVGCYDMGGNVWEWCHDWYLDTYYDGGSMSDPTGPATGSERVLRGGSWNYYDYDCRTASRTSDAPSNAYQCHGFRVVCPKSAAP